MSSWDSSQWCPGNVDTEDQMKILEKLQSDKNLATQVPHDLEAEQHRVHPYKGASNALYVYAT